MKKLQRSQARPRPVNRDGQAVGLDLGATSARATVLSLNTKDGSAARVAAVASVPLPPGAVVTGGVNDPAAVTQALKRLWDVHRLGCRGVVLGVANPQVVVRPLQIPHLTRQQRAKALPFQARDLIALPINEVILDFVPLGDPDPKTGMVSGLLLATPRRPVLVTVQAVERAGLKVARVDLSSFGALRSVAVRNLSVQAVIDMGAHLTSIVIHQHGVPRLVRTLARGGQELTEHLAEKLDLRPEAAEEAKRAIGIDGDADAVTFQLQAAIRPLLSEIRSSINYFRSAHGGADVEAISLTGQAAALPGLAATISGQNGAPTSVVDPMQHIDQAVPSKNGRRAGPDAHGSAVSIGLALGAVA